MDYAVLKNISYGMYILAAKDENKPTGCIINTLVQITSKHPIIAVSVSKLNYTYEVIKKTSSFSISILSEDIEPIIITRFGFYSGNTVDKFSGIKHEIIDENPIITENCCGNLICKVIQVVDMETHAVVYGRIVNIFQGMNKKPMTYSYYQTVLKGSASKYAPTFLEENTGLWVCSICGYQHNRDINLEDDAFRCPVCGSRKEKFYIKN